MARVLRTDVHLGGKVYRAGSTPEPQIAERISNPRAWTEAGDTTEQSAVSPAPAPQLTEPVPEQPNPAGTGADQAAAGVQTGAAAGDPTAAADPPLPEAAPLLKAPPRSGKGSGLDAWQAYASGYGVDVAPDADRGDIIAACQRAGLLDDTDD